jgi:TrmH family RNA methyltransferase
VSGPGADRTRSISSANAEYQLLAALVGNRSKRHRQRRFLVQGVRAIDAALGSGWPVASVLLSDAAKSAWSRALTERAPGAEVVKVRAALLDQLSQRDEGAEALLVARVQPRSSESLDAATDGPLVIIEAIQNPGNLGTIFRAAAGLGAGGLVLTGHAADPYDPQCVRASAGALFHVPFATAVSLSALSESLRRRLIGLDPGGAAIDEVDLSGRIALIAGNERTGLSRAALEASTLTAIPTPGPVDSLNVSVAIAIALAEVQRRRRASGG